jgi:ethanolamine utilization protein EutP (predicted NTPase)
MLFKDEWLKLGIKKKIGVVSKDLAAKQRSVVERLRR